MKTKVQRIALILSAIFILVIGIWIGKRLGGNHGTIRSDENSDLSSSQNSETKAGGSDSRRSAKNEKSELSPAQLEILRELRNARSLNAETRTAPLLKALEQTTKLPLTKNLLDELQEIVNEGELESSNYIFSLMEQREEKEAVAFLVNATAHSDEAISGRALFALEAIAGTVFQTREKAVEWASTWKPDPERAKLFSPVEEPSDNVSVIPADRLPGPRSNARKNPEAPQETAKPENE